MGLDPQAEAVRELMASMQLPPIEQMTVEQARASTAGLALLQGDPEHVGRVDDIAVPGPGGEMPVRVYTPDSSEGGPLVVYFHGGGWVIGDIDLLDRPCRALANASRAVVASVGYRLAPEHRFPAAVEDAYEATKWLAEHARDLGADPERVVVAGDSAGANLAAVTALLARDRRTPRLALQVLYCPVTAAPGREGSYDEVGEGYMLTRAAMEWFWGHYGVEGERDQRAEPLHASNHSDLAPALVMVASHDPLRDEGVAYANALRAAGTPVDLKTYDGQMHDFLWIMGAVDAARQAIDDIADAISRLATDSTEAKL